MEVCEVFEPMCQKQRSTGQKVTERQHLLGKRWYTVVVHQAEGLKAPFAPTCPAVDQVDVGAEGGI